MNTKALFSRIFFLLFCVAILATSCETPEDETNEIEFQGVDKNVVRPGTQGS